MDGTILMFKGRAVEELTKDELIAVLKETYEIYEQQRERNKRERELMNLFLKLK
jgi:hypothetical protein